MYYLELPGEGKKKEKTCIIIYIIYASKIRENAYNSCSIFVITIIRIRETWQRRTRPIIHKGKILIPHSITIES